MSYLNLDLDYFTHPKTMRLVGLLGKESEVLPIRLWCYCGKHHCESGKLSDYSPQEIESVVGWWGKPGLMIEAMVKVGLLIENGSGYIVKDWLDHQGHLAMFKTRAKMAARKRWGISNATSTAKEVPKQSPKPNLTKPNQTKPNLKEILSQSEALLSSFSPLLREKVNIYLDRNAKRNKCGFITEGRRNTLLLEIANSRDRWKEDSIFEFAMEQAISRDKCSIAYVNAIIKNKKTERPM